VENFLKPFIFAMDVLAETMYIGPFRNAIHIGSNEAYCDIQTGNTFINAFNNFKTGNDPDSNEAFHEMTEELRRIFGWRKTDNWRAAFEMQRSELDGTDLGTFLNALY
jgi:hypothetical protein